MVNTSSIVVTHFINPHLFWYHEVNAFKKEFQNIKNMEDELSVMYEEKLLVCDRNLIVKVGDPVAVFYLAWNKYIRAEILHRPQTDEEEFVVWATDYGFPFLTKKNTMRLMPTKMTKRIDHIRRGGIAGIIPGEFKFNPYKGGLNFEKQNIWLQRVCNDVQKKLLSTSLITFVDEYQTFNEHHWGNLIITNPEGENINIRTYLITCKYGLKINSNFESLLQKLETIKLPHWMSNDGKPTTKTNSIVHNHYITIKKSNTNMDVNDSIRRKVEAWCVRQAELQNASSHTDNTDNNELNDSLTNSESIDSKNSIIFNDTISTMSREQHQRDNTQCYQVEGIHNETNINNDFDSSANEELALKLTQRNFINKLAKLQLKQNKMSTKDAMKLSFPSSEHFEIKPIKYSTPTSFKNKATDAQKLSSGGMTSECDSVTGATHSVYEIEQTQSHNSDLLAESIATKETLFESKCFEQKPPLSTCTIETSSKVTQKSIAARNTKLHTVKRSCANTEHSNGTAQAIATTTRLSNNILEKDMEALAVTNRDDTNSSLQRYSISSGSKVEPEKQIENNNLFTTENENANGNSPLEYNSSRIISSSCFEPFRTIAKEVQASLNVSNVLDPFEHCKVIPAGFDITRLCKYRDENHWHRKRTTRFNDKHPH